ncbi:MAG: type III-A CRISPR-associated protein Csm2 [Chloroflexi bacterium]|nr:type III-A CRISPR-associated protein Csm2 [Chloroflexota bacterium]
MERGQQRTQHSAEPARPNLTQIMTGDEVSSAQEIVTAAQAWGEYLKREELKSSQIRNVFGEVRRIEMSWPVDSHNSTAERELILLKPKLAYQAARDPKRDKRTGRGPVKSLEELISPAIDMVQGDRQRFQRFVDYFEAILAYHKAAGGE